MRHASIGAVRNTFHSEEPNYPTHYALSLGENFVRGTDFVPVKAQGFPTYSAVWESTLGIILKKNSQALADDTWTKMFADKVNDHLKAGSVTALSVDLQRQMNGAAVTVHVDLSEKDVLALHQIAEVLSFIGEGRTHTGE